MCQNKIYKTQIKNQTHSNTRQVKLIRHHREKIYNRQFKDATCRLVSLYHNNRLQILQYVKYSKKNNIAKEIAKYCDKLCVFGQKVKPKQKNNIKHKNPSRSRELNSGPLVPKADALPLHP